MADFPDYDPLMDGEDIPRSRSHLAKGKGFTQVFTDFWYPEIASLAACPPAFTVLCWCLKHANKANQVYVTQARLADGTGLSLRSLHRATAFLEKGNFLIREGKTFCLSEEVFWRNSKPANRHVQKIIAAPIVQKKVRAKRPKLVKAKKRDEAVA